MLLTELEGAEDWRYALWGTVLLLVNLGTVLLAVVLQIAEESRKTVLQLMLLEREIRVGRADAVFFRARVTMILACRVARCFCGCRRPRFSWTASRCARTSSACNALPG